MKNHFRYFLAGSILILVALTQAACDGCGEPEKSVRIPEVDESRLTPVDVHIARYEKALFSIKRSQFQAGLKKIQPEYALFLNGDLEEAENIEQLKAYVEDPAIRDHYTACMKKYPDLSGLETTLSKAFAYYHYWFPEKPVPKVFTYISGGDFNAPIKNADSAIIIALDLYLGKDYGFYSSYGMPRYKSIYMDEPYLARDIMEELAIPLCSSEAREGSFLENMIGMGKIMYFLDVTLLDTPDSIKIKYSHPGLEWCKRNEGNIWAFFIEHKLLYSQNRSDFLKFFSDGPFTSAFGKESPPRIAIWVGWQIVRGYMNENPAADIRSLLRESDAQKILQKSKYKPKKQA